VTTVNMLEARNNLSKLVEAVESGAESEIVIARNGKPAVRLVPLDGRKGGVRLGAAKGMFEVPDTIDALNDEIAKMFYGDDDDA
jgi:prevent-host-death family protein